MAIGDDIGLPGRAKAYPVTDIRGIASETAAVLKSEGIRTTLGLLRHAKTPHQRLKLAAKVGTDEKHVLEWATSADRMRVKGIGWEYSELLRSVGVRTANELKYRNPRRLAEAMDAANSKRKLVRLLPSEGTVKRWIENARKLPAAIKY